MGIRLEVVHPGKRFLIRLAIIRFSLAVICFIYAVTVLSHPVIMSPFRWVAQILCLMTAFVALCIAGMRPLAYLTRTVEFYENGIVLYQMELPLEKLLIICWQEDQFRLLGLIPLKWIPERRMICVFRSLEEKKNLRHRICISERYFPGLMDAFDRAYEHSIPSEYHSKFSYFLPKLQGKDLLPQITLALNEDVKSVEEDSTKDAPPDI